MRAFAIAMCLVAATAQTPVKLPDQLKGKQVVSDVAFAEGPVFDSHGVLYFANYQKYGTIGVMQPDGSASIWMELPEGTLPAGLKIDAHGNLYVADFKGARVLRITPEKQITLIPGDDKAVRLRGVNDLCFDRAGNLFFTDTAGSSAAHPFGAIYRYSADGRLTKVASGLPFPNGIVVDPDQTKLYVSDSGTSSILVFDLARDGTLTNKRLVYHFRTPSVDGISFDETGRLWVARLEGGTVDVITKAGKWLASYDLSMGRVTNMAWWNHQLYITVAGGNGIYRYDVGVDGAPVIPAQ
jgi:gluconolactonase